MEITYNATAYLGSYQNLENIVRGDLMPVLAMGDENPYFEGEGYPKIGTAVLTVTLHSNDKIVSGQIEALNTQLQKMRAEHQKAQNAILDKISKLQAITNQA